ncbi:hypothetical protein HZA56_02015 [Candidatus Poribacteria bacterium]|nr:hypothetical protein [Candidatus Poribacteria bacterium]
MFLRNTILRSVPPICWLPLITAFGCLITGTAIASSSNPQPPAFSEITASVKDDGNTVFYSKHQIRNWFPISLESIRLNTTEQVEIIDVRDLDGRFLRFSQTAENGRNDIIVIPREPVPVDESIELFTVSLHKNLVQKRGDTVVFEYDYTPDLPTRLKYTAIIPAGAHDERDTILLLLRAVTGQVLMRFYELDMQTQ